MKRIFGAAIFLAAGSTLIAQEKPVIMMDSKKNLPPANLGNLSRNVKIKLATFNEPLPGYLKSLTWNAVPPVWGSGYTEYKDLDPLLAEEVKKQGIPGIQVAVLRNNQLVYLRGFGYSDLDTEAPFLPSQATRVGSISKVVTGVIIFRLVEAGLLSLDTNIHDLWVSKTGRDLGAKLGEKDKALFKQWTIRNLLEMANGYNGNFGWSYDSLAQVVNKSLPLHKWDLLEAVIGINTNLQLPGKITSYNNTAFMLLGRAAELVTNKNLATLIHDHITNVIKIPDSMLHFSDNQNNHKDPSRGQEPHYYQFAPPTSHRWNGQPGIVSEAYGGLDMFSLGGAGSIAFSAEGLAKFVMAVQSVGSKDRVLALGRKLPPILNATSWAEYTKPPKFVVPDATTFYRAGQMYKTEGGRFCIEHGATLGHATGTLKYMQYGKSDYQMIILANSQKPESINLDAFAMTAYKFLTPKLK
ncbi:MAG TPA: serine hydrolase domain-containing protein [Fimbriimonas sp.]|nr:serine hydrolase domain-containing protein [Fimbriimonas sp.]